MLMLNVYSFLNLRFNQLNKIAVDNVDYGINTPVNIKRAKKMLNDITRYLLSDYNMRNLDENGYDYNDNIRINHYPYITIKHSCHNILDDVSALKVNHGVVDYNNVTISNLAKITNLLIWAIASHTHNSFGIFISQWNYTKVLEQEDTPLAMVINSVDKFFTKNNANFSVLDCDSYKEINDTLRNFAKYSLSTKTFNAERLINNIMAPKVNVSNTNLIKFVIKNAKKISKDGSNNFNVLSLLAKYHIVKGSKLQNKLVQKISYNNDFKVARGYAIAISKIASDKALYFYNKNNPWSVKQVSGNDIKVIMKRSLNAKSDLKKALEQRKQLNKKINQLKKF